MEPAFPASVVAFLKANPGYTKKFAALGLPPQEAYFRLRVLEDWKVIAPRLRARIGNVLDIGCGIAGIDLLVHQARPRATLFLADKSRREQEEGSFDVIGTAREFLTANGVPDRRIVTLSSQSKVLHERLRQERFDLILSLRGLAYMFPYGVYRETLKTVLAPGGRLILDVRLMDKDKLKESPVICERFEKAGFPTERRVIKQLEEDFGKVSEIGRSQEYVRVLAVRG